MKRPKRPRGELRLPVLPEVLRPPADAEPRPQLPVLSGPATRRRGRRAPSFGLGFWLAIVGIGVAAAVVALVLAQPLGGPTTSGPAGVTRTASTTTAPPPATTAAGTTLPSPPAKAPAGPFRFATVREPAAALAAVAQSASVLLGPSETWIVGGEPGGRPVATIARVSAAGNAVVAGAFEEPLAEAGFAAGGGSLYLAGGFTGAKYGTAVLRFTPPNGNAALLARLPAAVRRPAVALLGGRLYVAGGRTASGDTRGLYSVDVSSGAVRTLASLPRPVSGAALVVVDGKLYLLEGEQVLRLDPATGRAAPAGTLPATLRGAASLGDGGLVVAGGRAYRLRPAR